jgi:hypothetical protein
VAKGDDVPAVIEQYVSSRELTAPEQSSDGFSRSNKRTLRSRGGST